MFCQAIINVIRSVLTDSGPDIGGVCQRHPLLARFHAAAAVLDFGREAALVGVGPPSPRVRVGRG